MRTIHVHFQRFRDVHLGDLFGACGVYVLWDSQARARPTYIGEGNILKRFADHWSREDVTFAMPLDGYVAILGDHGHRPSKQEACVIEHLLLAVGDDTDRCPSVNAHPGHRAWLRAMCDRERTIRMALSGYDPLSHPREARPLARNREVKAWIDPTEGLFIQHDWQLRRLRKV